MRTNIVLDEELIELAFRYTDVTTKRELVHQALQEFVQNHARRDVRELLGTVDLDQDYDYKKHREQDQ
jgi:Arc/MetJ family transcription regulator